MTMIDCIQVSSEFSPPPPGSVNVMLGDPVEGPGGRWIPCVTKADGSVYWPGLFRVGPGQRQVCATSSATKSCDAALAEAVALAVCAAS